MTLTAELPLPEGATSILSDRIGLLPRRQARSRKSPFGDPVCEIRSMIVTGKVLHLPSNEIDLSCQQTADLSKRRLAMTARDGA